MFDDLRQNCREKTFDMVFWAGGHAQLKDLLRYQRQSTATSLPKRDSGGGGPHGMVQTEGAA